MRRPLGNIVTAGHTMGKWERVSALMSTAPTLFFFFFSAFRSEVKQKINQDYYFRLLIAVDSTGLAAVE